MRFETDKYLPQTVTNTTIFLQRALTLVTTVSHLHSTLTEAPNISTRRSCEQLSPQYLDNSLLTSLYLSSLLRRRPYLVGVVPSRWMTTWDKMCNTRLLQPHLMNSSYTFPHHYQQQWAHTLYTLYLNNE